MMMTRRDLHPRSWSTTLNGTAAAKDMTTSAAELATAAAGAAAAWARTNATRLRRYVGQSQARTVERHRVPSDVVLVGSAALGVVLSIVLRRLWGKRR
jgi:hypothetical protein